MLDNAFVQGAVQSCKVLPDQERMDLSLVVRPSPDSPLHDRPPQIVDVRVSRAVHTLVPIPIGTIVRVRGLPYSNTRQVSLRNFLSRLPKGCQVNLPDGVGPSDITRNITWGYIRATMIVSVRAGDDFNEGQIDGLVVSDRPFRSSLDNCSCVRLVTYPFRALDTDREGHEKAVYITMAMPSGQTYLKKSRVTAWGAWVSTTTRTTLADLMKNKRARGLTITDADGGPLDLRRIEMTSRNLVLYPIQSYMSETGPEVLERDARLHTAASVPEVEELLDEQSTDEMLEEPLAEAGA